MSSPSLGKILFRGGLWAASGRSLAIVQVFVLSVVLARLLPPGEFGAWVIALSLVSFGITLGGFGLDRAGVRLISEQYARGATAALLKTVRTTLVLAPAGALGVALLYLLVHRVVVSRVFDAAGLVPVGAAIGVWIFAGVVQRQLAEVFRAIQDIRMATIFGGLKNTGILSSLSVLAGVGALYLLGVARLAPLVWLSAALTAAIAVLAAATLWGSLRRMRRARPTVGSSELRPAIGVAGILAIALPLLLIELLTVARTEIDVWLVGASLDSEMVAGFGAAVRLVALVYTPLMVVSSVLAPLVAEAHARGGRQELERTARLAATAAFLPALGIALLLEIFAPQLLGLVFGEFYRQAGLLLRLLTIGQLINVLAGPNVLVLMMRGGERAALFGMLVTLAYVGVVGWFAALAFGAPGVAAVSASGLVLQNLIMTFLVRRLVGVWTLPYFSARTLGGVARRLWGSAGKGDRGQDG